MSWCKRWTIWLLEHLLRCGQELHLPAVLAYWDLGWGVVVKVSMELAWSLTPVDLIMKMMMIVASFFQPRALSGWCGHHHISSLTSPKKGAASLFAFSENIWKGQMVKVVDYLLLIAFSRDMQRFGCPGPTPMQSIDLMPPLPRPLLLFNTKFLMGCPLHVGVWWMPRATASCTSLAVSLYIKSTLTLTCVMVGECHVDGNRVACWGFVCGIFCVLMWGLDGGVEWGAGGTGMVFFF